MRELRARLDAPVPAGGEGCLDPLDPAFAKRYPEADLRRSRWATEEQIRGEGWGFYLLKPGELTSESPG